MNAVEIESAVSDFAAEPFDAAEFPFRFLAAFDKKETTLKRLRKGDSNKSDVPGAVLLQANIHLAVCPVGETRGTLERLRASPKTSAAKAKFVLATDGLVLEAEDLLSGEAIAPDYPHFGEHIGFFLPLAGISTVREIKDNPIDVRATGRLNKLYVELLRQNPEWTTEARRHGGPCCVLQGRSFPACHARPSCREQGRTDQKPGHVLPPESRGLEDGGQAVHSPSTEELAGFGPDQRSGADSVTPAEGRSTI